MERGEKQTASSNQKKKIEPTFVPEWLKTTTTATGGGGSSNHIAGSSSYTERISSSYRRSSSTNGSLNHDKDTSLHSRPYSSFGRSNRDRDREKDVDFRDRKETIKLENGFQDLPDSFISSRSEKDALRRSQSLISGRQSDSWAKRPGNGTTNSNFLASGSIVSSISKASFDREFPSLGAEDKHGPPEIGRVSSPGLSSAIQILPLGCSALIGGDGWTSALAEVPVIVGGNGPSFSPVQQAATSTTSTVSSTTTGLNMAETLAQAPSRARAAPQVSVDSQKLEELAIKQSRQLIPVTPSMPKTSVGLMPLHI
ncbi:hypothetical protein Taro_022212 [Colocasia esculenta]|uniref:Uncharacterized protein n=1 Tax=Colocasia esculenta TaxID=4460 RepID=A0A843UTT6_COLES|nr:hypothetical protein [Colocasia esculenta]